MRDDVVREFEKPHLFIYIYQGLPISISLMSRKKKVNQTNY